MSKSTDRAFSLARERYAALGVNVDAALKALAKIPISLHCWQGDDVGGFENVGGVLGADSSPREIILARRAHRMNCAPTSRRHSRSSRENIA